MSKQKEIIQKLLAKADVQINGSRPWDITVHDDELYARIISGGNLALGESYMDGWWDCPAIDQFISRALKAKLSQELSFSLDSLWSYITAVSSNRGSIRRSFEIGEKHYDTGNDLFEKMLDKRLVYTCGYWAKAKTLDGAQKDKLDLVCRKLNLKKGQKVLDIGCGWGSFAKYAAETYGVKVVGVTVSKEQVELAKKLCEGLPIEIRLQDYRDVNEQFDHIVSLGMFEHVGIKNYRTYMEVANKCLKDEGLFLLHTIGKNTSTLSGDRWMGKYIFPGGMLPTVEWIAKSVEGLFIMEDWHNFGPDYDKTLMTWFKNFDTAWPSLKDKYGKRFYRMWKYYLLICAGSFRARDIQLWQIVLSKKGVVGGYKSVR
ncbi:MAG: cyclopropane fatty acyl phospholipid synthase [Parcubacteria group bacterium]|nr:cyclopropane fatty acyl phospholipid synthase [Parcubacteria group bacterium]